MSKYSIKCMGQKLNKKIICILYPTDQVVFLIPLHVTTHIVWLHGNEADYFFINKKSL